MHVHVHFPLPERFHAEISQYFKLSTEISAKGVWDFTKVNPLKQGGKYLKKRLYKRGKRINDHYMQHTNWTRCTCRELWWVQRTSNYSYVYSSKNGWHALNYLHFLRVSTYSSKLFNPFIRYSQRGKPNLLQLHMISFKHRQQTRQQ